MNTLIDTFSVTDLRHKTSKVLKEVEKKGFIYLLRRSRPEAAIVNINYLKALQESYEDYLDTIEFDQTIKLKRVSLTKHKKSVAKTR